jgi:Putative quorum-sensing-regulated virulence factor
VQTRTEPVMTGKTFLMPFGKFSGKPLPELPDSYLMWLSQPDRLQTLYPRTCAAVAAEVARRQDAAKTSPPKVRLGSMPRRRTRRPFDDGVTPGAGRACCRRAVVGGGVPGR